MNNPILSVIIPMYNAEATIEKCAASLIQQTIDNLELIFVDDCSSDTTVEILEPLLSNSNRKYTIIRNEVNLGQSRSRKIGLEIANGEFITFVDADDWVCNEMYERMLDASSSRSTDIVSCDFYCDFHQKQIIEKSRCNDVIKGILTNTYPGSLWNKIFRKRLFDNSVKWPLQNMGEDGALCIQLILNSSSIKHLNEPLYHYCVNLSSTVNSRSLESCVKRFNGLIESSEIIFDFLKAKGLFKKYASSVFFRKVYIKLLLSPVVNDKMIYKMMSDVYPEITLRRVMLSSIPIMMKFRYLLLLTRLYPYLADISRVFRGVK